MSTQKRRTIWATDDEWRHLKERAADAGLNVSGLIRVALTQGVGLADTVRFGSPRPAPKRTSK